MGKIVTRGFVAVDNSHTTALDRTVKGDSFLFGRVDASQNFEGFDVVGTVTDFSLREYGTAPWLPDLLVTADKKVSDKVSLGAGYDFGLKSGLGRVKYETDLDGRKLDLGALWFQRGNEVRAEGEFNPNSRHSFWGAYAFNHGIFKRAANPNLAHPTYVNLKQREGYLLPPFTFPVAAKACSYTFNNGNYSVQGAYDISRKAPFVIVNGSPRSDVNVKAGYAVADRTALVEVNYKDKEARRNSYVPVVRAFVKGPVSEKGVGPFGFGFLLEKVFDW
eukprot:jgi/Chrzof1/10858/Cz05g15010.t1